MKPTLVNVIKNYLQPSYLMSYFKGPSKPTNNSALIETVSESFTTKLIMHFPQIFLLFGYIKITNESKLFRSHNLNRKTPLGCLI